ncbi:unnamed protein product [Blepharisma stoltei]|uniref:WW domain-containing protein n=1 Tax=Blepharisma stoltei TaxID=1481888 RepID=A0AAU9J027_9CILI|nr:unnamed protein product [Blepharisma stoltei]
MENSVILEEEIDENYEPTEEEIIEYGIWLGLTLPDDEDLLYIAREGLKAPLPQQWKPCKTREGDIYYFNFETGQSEWEHPCDGHYKQLVREAKQAKTKQNQSNTKKPKNSNTSDAEKLNRISPLKKSPLGKSPELGEFANRKQELEESFAEEVDKMRQEYDEKKREIKRKMDEELDKLEGDAEKVNKIEEQKARLDFEQKIENKKEIVRKEMQRIEKEKIAKENRETIDKLEDLKRNYKTEFEENKQKILQKLKLENEEEIKKIEINIRNEIENLKEQVEINKGKIEWQLKEQEDLEGRYKKKIERLRADSEDQLNREIKKLEKDYEWQLKETKEENGNDLSPEEKSLLKKVEQDELIEFQQKLSGFKNELQYNLIRERELKEAKERNKRQNKDSNYDNEKTQAEIRLTKQKADNITDYKKRKEIEYRQQVKEIENKYSNLLETEEKQFSYSFDSFDETKNIYEEKLKLLQRDIAVSQNQLFMKEEKIKNLKEEKIRLEMEARRAASEAEDLCGKGSHIETAVIQDLTKQIIERDHELLKLKDHNPSRIEKLEKELESLKELFIRQRRSSADPNMQRKPASSRSLEELKHLKQNLLIKRKEAKEIQKMLEMDQMKWRRDIKEYKMNPNEKRRKELATVKTILEKQIAKHNEKVKEIRIAEERIKEKEMEENLYEDQLMKEELSSGDEEKILESWRNKGESYDITGDITQNKWAYHVRQPWHYNNARVYQQQLNVHAKNRENMRDIFSRHGMWLNNMKDELNKVATPMKVNMSKYLV